MFCLNHPLEVYLYCSFLFLALEFFIVVASMFKLLKYNFYELFFPLFPGKGQEYWAEENVNEEMPACRQMFNIFHPFDPVAYRFISHIYFIAIIILFTFSGICCINFHSKMCHPLRKSILLQSGGPIISWFQHLQ